MKIEQPKTKNVKNERNKEKSETLEIKTFIIFLFRIEFSNSYYRCFYIYEHNNPTTVHCSGTVPTIHSKFVDKSCAIAKKIEFCTVAIDKESVRVSYLNHVYAQGTMETLIINQNTAR